MPFWRIRNWKGLKDRNSKELGGIGDWERGCFQLKNPSKMEGWVFKMKSF